ADGVVTLQIIFPAPAVEAETGRGAGAAALEDDRPGVAKPDVAERLLDHQDVRAGHLSGHLGALRIGSDEANFLASAASPNRPGEGDDLLPGRFEVILPQVDVAWKADPHPLVMRPFRRLTCRHGASAYWPVRDWSRTARNSALGYQF